MPGGKKNDRPATPPWKVEGHPDGTPGAGPNRPNQRPAWMRFGWMLLVLLAVNWVVSSFLLAPPARAAVSYTFFLTQVDAKNISDVTSTGDTIEGA
ncbi:MAG: cell division protease FtsH, partial [Actinoplanes sp.]|nr:cell division protease FtsH [Actinoplanes sp.]